MTGSLKNDLIKEQDRLTCKVTKLSRELSLMHAQFTKLQDDLITLEGGGVVDSKNAPDS